MVYLAQNEDTSRNIIPRGGATGRRMKGAMHEKDNGGGAKIANKTYYFGVVCPVVH